MQWEGKLFLQRMGRGGDACRTKFAMTSFGGDVDVADAAQHLAHTRILRALEAAFGVVDKGLPIVPFV